MSQLQRHENLSLYGNVILKNRDFIMLVLDATTKSIQFKLSAAVAANQLPFMASYFDTNGTTTTPGEQDGASSNTTAVPVVSSPAASTQRLVKNITIRNADTAAATVTVIYNNNATLRNIVVVTLAIGDQLIYEDGHGWITIDSNGNTKTTGGSGGSNPTFSSVTFSNTATGGIVGTTTNDSAAMGYVGEFIISSIPSTTAVSLTTNIPANVTSISLTAGDWDVWGSVSFSDAASTTRTYKLAWISTISASFPGGATTVTDTNPSSLPLGGVDNTYTVPTQRISIASTTTVYLSAQAGFAVSTSKAYGAIEARRAR